jgi:hypothetical protein
MIGWTQDEMKIFFDLEIGHVCGMVYMAVYKDDTIYTFRLDT